MIAIAPMSSMIAMASNRALSATGTREPSRASRPSAKAMSVAAGIAQPRKFSGEPRLSATKTIAGIAIPPIAAMMGSEACFQLRSWPVTISRFTSSPMRKKNSAISPSLIHSSSGLSIATRLPALNATGVDSSFW